MKFVILSLLSIVLFKTGNAIVINPVPDQYVDNGNTVMLSCIVSGATAGTTMNWIRTNEKGKAKTISFDSQIVPNEYKDRYTIRNDGVTNRQYILTIRDAQIGDSGEWTCTAFPEVGVSTSMQFMLTVLSPPKIEAISPAPGDLRYDYNYTLYCNATGSPKPTIKWRRVSPQYLPDYRPFSIGRLFNLTNVTANHRGLYECIASNGIGEAARGSVKIAFPYKPEVKAVREEILLPKNVAGNISCSCEADPKVTRVSDVRWYKGSTQLVSTDTLNYLMDVEDYDRYSDRTVAILTIRNVTSNKEGEYKCRFRNRMGEMEKSIRVNVGAVADQKAGKVPSGATTIGSTAVCLSIIMAVLVAYFQ